LSGTAFQLHTQRKTRLDRREYQDGYPLRESRALNSLQFKSECNQNNSFFLNVKNIFYIFSKKPFD
jgi:hypothetical protein